MPQFKDVAIEGTAYLWVATNDTGGSGADLDSGNLNFDVRLAGATASDAPIYSGTGSLLSHANYPPGAYELAIPCTAANGFAAGNEYAVFATGLVDAENPSGFAGSIKVVASGDTLHSAAARTMDTTDSDSVLLDSTQLAAIAGAIWNALRASYNVEDSFGNVINDLTTESGGGVYQLAAGALANEEPISADLTYIHGSALTETSAGYLAAAFVKLFDVATPLLVASSAMRGTDGAALASDWTGTLATNLGTLFSRAITTGAIPNAAAGANGGLAIVDANGRTDVNLEAILGTALTETSAGYLAAAFKKLFDVATPLLVASDVMRGTDGAALASAYTGTRAGYLDNLSGGAVALASGVDLTSIHGTALTESGAGRLAAAFVKLFDVVTPLLVASDAMRGTDNAATAAKLLDYVQLLARSDAAITTDNAVALGEINTNEGSGAGDFSNQTEAVEALRDRGDAAWVTGTGTSTLTAQDVADALKLAPTAGAPATGSVNKDLDTLTTGVNVTTIEGSDATDQINAALDTALFTGAIPLLLTSGSIGERLKTMDDAYTAARAAYLDELAAANIPADVDAILDDTGTTGVKVAADAIADAQLAADTDVYEARVTLFVDAANSEDSYTVGFFKNGTPVLSGITVPAMTIYQMNAAGTVLLNGVTLLQASTLGLYYYDSSTQTTAGVAYQAKVTATIDGSSRTMTCPVGRDSSA